MNHVRAEHHHDRNRHWRPYGELGAAGDVSRTASSLGEIADLGVDALEHAAVERLDAVLSTEQHKLRLEASVTGQRFGLTGLELFQHILGAMNLSEEQKQAMAAARRALRGIREAMSPHLALLLTDEQRQQIAASE